MSDELKVNDTETRQWIDQLDEASKIELKRRALEKRAVMTRPSCEFVVKSTDTSFDYSASDTPDDVVRSVAAQMSGGRLKPLTDDERLERERWREEQAFFAQERQIEYERRQAEQEAVARHEAALERAELNRQARERASAEYRERAERRSRDSDLAALRHEAQQSAMWRGAVQGEIRRQHVQSLYGELEKLLSPSPEPDHPVEVIERDPLGSANFFDDDYNPNYYADKFAGKFKR